MPQQTFDTRRMGELGRRSEPAVNGILVGPDDGIGLARELTTLCADLDRLREMGAHGRTRYEANHRIEGFLASTWRQYGEVAGGWPSSF